MQAGRVASPLRAIGVERCKRLSCVPQSSWTSQAPAKIAMPALSIKHVYSIMPVQQWVTPLSQEDWKELDVDVMIRKR